MSLFSVKWAKEDTSLQHHCEVVMRYWRGEPENGGGLWKEF